MYRILVIESDVTLAQQLAGQLAQEQYAVETAATWRNALQQMSEVRYNLILLDVVLSDGQGRSLCCSIRRHCTCPILFIGSRSDREVILDALKNSGDDFLVKPLRGEELLARVDAIFRRTVTSTQEKAVAPYYSFSVDAANRRIVREEREVQLSSIEYDILCYMLEQPDVLLSYHDIYRHVWKSDSLGDVRTLMVHISNLRKKIDPEHNGVIKTVRGTGYLFSDI